jgi:hypothetical protein
MAGILHYEGQETLGQAALKNTGVPTLYIGLYTNASALNKDHKMTNITEVTGGGYARLPINAADWTMDINKTINGGTLFIQPRQSWVFNAAVGNVTGYFITTSLTGTTGKLISSEHFPSVANANQADFEIRIVPRHEFK